MAWVAKSISSSSHPQRRPLIIVSTIFLIILSSTFFPFTFSPTATLSQFSIFRSLSSSQVPFRATELTIDDSNDSDIRKHSFVTKYYDTDKQPSTLILVATKDESSWGRNRGESVRTFEDFLELIGRQRLPPRDVSLGVHTSSILDLERYTDILLHSDVPIASIQIIYAPDTDFKVGAADSGKSAGIRNFLTKEVLKGQDHIVWIDPDIYLLPDGLFKRLREVVSQKISNFDVANVAKNEREKLLPSGLVTVFCRQAGYTDMARNAWAGPSKAALKQWQQGMLHHDTAKPLASWPIPMSQLIEQTSDDSLVRLDGVGETVLYIKADLIRKGLRWPHSGKADSEGLCFSAMEMGWGCYGLGGCWETRHTDL
ncbi:hypothetical protein H072_644 [Dactylellina haptotyla CBS 200.50]|uniref:Nucleotide-diphospho-sugar transferase domain-containing protein n=1 Tax=Dactylellina haptotyla (strain CBS 200.50) TaxID=1284197 RepID=S8ARH4_DACHA|nr:hypothetical protein H072_644 [Dactylellina haptotyla CBS 200.50]